MTALYFFHVFICCIVILFFITALLVSVVHCESGLQISMANLPIGEGNCTQVFVTNKWNWSETLQVQATETHRTASRSCRLDRVDMTSISRLLTVRQLCRGLIIAERQKQAKVSGSERRRWLLLSWKEKFPSNSLQLRSTQLAWNSQWVLFKIAGLLPDRPRTFLLLLHLYTSLFY